MYWSPYIPLFY
jgi:hypothetical protein